MIINLNFGFICRIFKIFRSLFTFSPRQEGRPALAFGSKRKNACARGLLNLLPNKPKVQVIRNLFVIVLFFHGCSCGKPSNDSKPKIGIDSSWSLLNFGNQTAYVNGFSEELLMEIAAREGIQFEKVSANWDVLFSGLKENKYDAVLTSLPPYTFNLAKYDFSQNFLALGPVFIVPVHATYKKLSQIINMPIGVLNGDSSANILGKYPDIRVAYYTSVPDLLNAAVTGDVAGVLLSRIPAINYVSDLYKNKLKIVSAPLNDEGIHLIAEKGKQEALIQSFDEGLKILKKNKKLKNLLRKWSL
jgi:polar amino acid transport system substrate-binding protein